MRPIAESRFFSSNSSSTNMRSAPRSPRNFSSVRGSRPVAVREVRAQDVWSSACAARSFACSPAGRASRTRPHHVHVERRPGVLEREQPDPQGAFHERHAVPRRALADDRGKAGIGDDQTLYDKPVALDMNPGGVVVSLR
jgi:hypothetical protein